MQGRQWLLNKHILPKIKSKQLSELNRAAIRACVREIQGSCKPSKIYPEKSGHRTANACKALIARVLEWAVDEEIILGNPAARMKKMFDDTPARRINKCDETILRAFWNEIESGDIQKTGKATALCCQLIILTLQRPNEVVKAHRADFHFDRLLWLPRESLTKTNVMYRVPLTQWTAALFQRAFKQSGSEWAFPGLDESPMEAHNTNTFWQRIRGRLIKDGKLTSADVTLYDCSRRFGRAGDRRDIRFQRSSSRGRHQSRRSRPKDAAALQCERDAPRTETRASSLAGRIAQDRPKRALAGQRGSNQERHVTRELVAAECRASILGRTLYLWIQRVAGHMGGPPLPAVNRLVAGSIPARGAKF